MSIRMGLLAVLASGPRHAYDLRQEFERRTSGAWNLNMGQVSTTLASLVKAQLAAELPDSTESGAPRYAITAEGQQTVSSWWTQGVDRLAPAREEATIKVALAMTDPTVDMAAVLYAQRVAAMSAIRDLTRLKPPLVQDDAELAWDLTVDRQIFAAEAELRWLDHVTRRVGERPIASSGRARAPIPLQAANATSPTASGTASERDR